MRQYVYSVILCAFFCAGFKQAVTDPGKKGLIRMACGIALGIVILQPLSRLDMDALLQIPLPDMEEAEACIAAGEMKARQAQWEFIKSACESYILDKAAQLGSPLSVQILPNTEGIPAFAEITGGGPAEVQRQLQEVLSEDLGIPKEHQTWIWNQQSSS